MTALRALVLLCLLLAPPLLAQVRAPHHSAGDSSGKVAKPADEAAPEKAADTSTPAQKADPAPGSSGSGDCTHCDHRYRMPPRWHSFLPGMYR